MAYLFDLKSYLPPRVLKQESCVAWLAEAYEITQRKPRAQLAKVLEKFMAKPCQIEERRHFLPDFSHNDWEKMEIFRLKDLGTGEDLTVRNKFHERAVSKIFETLYENEATTPDTIMHVTCTGYSSPSPAYHVVSKKGWGQRTMVTQLYHMGCFAAIPAIRVAKANPRRTDVVHTELCSLHFDPTTFTPEQMVIHGLFSDGAAKYSVASGDFMDGRQAEFLIENTYEEVLPDTVDDMTWVLSSHGFKMTLSREVPSCIEKNIARFVDHLAKGTDTRTAIFAIHPGGPRIIDGISETLSLSPWQTHHSREVLKKHGNMSSATLPHIWEKISNDASVTPGTSVISLAFGPGLTLCGAWFKKSGQAGR